MNAPPPPKSRTEACARGEANCQGAGPQSHDAGEGGALGETGTLEMGRGEPVPRAHGPCGPSQTLPLDGPNVVSRAP